MRRAIVLLLRDNELSAGEIAERLGRGRPTISHHLSRLAENRVVKVRQAGAYRYYSLDVRGALAAWDRYLADESDAGEDEP